MNKNTGGAHGSAYWMDVDEAQSLGLTDGLGLYFGTTKAGGYLRYGGDGHSMVVAPPGAGKGVGFVVPNLVSYPGSMIVIDPKGENARQTARYRREGWGQDVFVLDPSGVTGLPSASYNPLSWLEGATPEDFMADVIEFSEAVVENGFGKETYWTSCAQNLFRALVFYLAGHDPDRLNLIEVYRLSRLPMRQFLEIMKAMQSSECPVPLLGSWIRELGTWFLGQTEDHQKYHLATLQESTTWMGNEGAQRIMATSDFDFRNLKRRPMTIYLCIHPLQLNAYRGWFRLLVSQAVKGVFEPIGKPVVTVNDQRVEAPVVFMLDEFARAVGRLAAIDNAIPQMRGYGGRFAFVLQSIGQAKDLYKEGWNSFEESCGLQMFMQARGDTAEHVSKRLGLTTQAVVSGGGMSQTGRPLWFPNEVSSCPKDDVIAFVEGRAPLRLKRITSYSDPHLSGRLDPSNMERQATDERPIALLDAVRSAAPLVRTEPSPAYQFSREDIAAAIGRKYPDKSLRFEGDIYGYDEATVSEAAGQQEQRFVPIINGSLIDAL